MYIFEIKMNRTELNFDMLADFGDNEPIRIDKRLNE